MNILFAYRLHFSKYNLSFISIISKISIIGLTLGVAVLITVLSVMNGFEKELRDKILSFTSHVNIYPHHKLDTESITSILKSNENILSYSTIHRNEVLVSSKATNNFPIILHNVNEKSESETSRITHLIIDGKFDLSRAENIVVGNVLANNLGVIVGDRIKLANYDKTFTKVNLLVTGIFDSGIHEYNQRYVVGSDMALTDKTNYEYIKLKLSEPLDALKISRELFDEYSIASSNWTETHNALFQAIGNEKRVMFIILALIIAIASFNIISSLSLLVLNKQKDIAILISLGFSKNKIKSIFLVQGIIIGLIGVSFGVLLGVLLANNINAIVLFLESLFNISLIAPDIYHFDSVPSIILFSDLMNIIILSFTMVLMSSIYPAKKATNIIPSKSLNI